MKFSPLMMTPIVQPLGEQPGQEPVCEGGEPTRPRPPQIGPGPDVEQLPHPDVR